MEFCRGVIPLYAYLCKNTQEVAEQYGFSENEIFQMMCDNEDFPLLLQDGEVFVSVKDFDRFLEKHYPAD